MTALYIKILCLDDTQLVSEELFMLLESSSASRKKTAVGHNES